ncbi:hypothetical protein B0A50_01496 [Salinomyces thailandicus]|uniref:Uncharacterized protein n=1 Tax=Salinomyces thailandicus TaxID=706561 RepID=A0A4U0UAH4_9PEZI|nr:hypothetical protein B0A50_01496 [Salinomyces thailandica]
MAAPDPSTQIVLPRIAITYCTSCRWMLRAAYYAQELMSTFGTSIGEVALIPTTGGIFTVQLTYKPDATLQAQHTLLWDRKAEGGFPETKILKQRVRNHIEPEKKLGHSDTPSSKDKPDSGPHSRQTDASGLSRPATEKEPPVKGASAQECEDCK